MIVRFVSIIINPFIIIFLNFLHSSVSLSDGKSPQVFRTILSILLDMNNVVVCTVSTRLVISKSPSPCTNPSVTALIIVGISITFMFHIFFYFRAGSRYLFLFQFYSLVRQGSKVNNYACSPFFVDYYKVWLRLGDPLLCQNLRGFCESHSPGLILDCAYTICSYGQTLNFAQFPDDILS